MDFVEISNKERVFVDVFTGSEYKATSGGRSVFVCVYLFSVKT